MSDNGGVVAGSSGERTSVTRLLLNVADDSTFGKGAKGENVGNAQGSLLATVHELAGGETLGSNESLDSGSVLVRVAESDPGKGSTSVRNKERYER
jgi:hypothetical protein